MKHIVEMSWIKNMAFKSVREDHEIIVDASKAAGGNNLGIRPKLLMLYSLAGCTGIDVISILKKMKVKVDDFNVIVEADVNDEHPKMYHTFKIIYQFWGVELPMDKLRRAVQLSEEKYCGVSALYKKGAEMSSEIQIMM